MSNTIEKFRSRLIIPEFPIIERAIKFFTNTAIIAEGYERVVIGERGPYIEFKENQIKAPLFVPKAEEWRFQSNWLRIICYQEYRTYVGNIMVYKQLNPVTYADYKVGMWYISPWDLVSDVYPVLVKGRKPKHAK